jgi:hypothetical protein
MSDDDDDDDTSHVGSTLDADGDTTMEQADLSDSEIEDEENQLSWFIYILVSRDTNICQNDLQKIGRRPFMPSSGKCLSSSMSKAAVVIHSSAPRKAVSTNRER